MSFPRRRFFNTTGPCNPESHYMLSLADRLHGAQLNHYLRDNLYWVLHVPRQIGKTTFFLSWMREINAKGEAVACYVTVESGEGLDLKHAMGAIAFAIRDGALKSDVPAPEIPNVSSTNILSQILADWAALVAPKPLIVLFDEVYILEEDVIKSFLHQLHDGFSTRAIGKFPLSIALIGMGNLENYISNEKDGKLVNPDSPFNLKTDSTLLGNFDRESVAKLFAQRTKETGQQIEKEALDYVYEQSSGHPWIVNKLFMHATMRVLDEESTATVTLAHLQEARNQMIIAHETHLCSLPHRLKEARVRKVILPLLINEIAELSLADEDVQYVIDIGLILWNSEEGFKIANPIYEEILIHHLCFAFHYALPHPKNFHWQNPDSSLNMDFLLQEFQNFWRRYSEVWEKDSNYTEAFPHLLLIAFLQRITNGEGQINREYAAGRGRLDLCVEFANKQYIIEIKLLRDYDTLETIREEGLEQIAKYRDRIDKSAPAYLVIFDRRSPEKQPSWDERIYRQLENSITILGC